MHKYSTNRSRLVCAYLFLLIAPVFLNIPPCRSDPLPALPPGVDAANALVLSASASYTLPGDAATARVAALNKVVVNGAPSVIPQSGGLSITHGGYTKSEAALAYSLPTPAPGVYEIYTLFTLGGVAEQEFHMSAGETEALANERASWKQSNEVSWQTSWRKADAKITLYPQDRSIKLNVAGYASGHKQIVAVVLARVSNLARDLDSQGASVRSAIEAWRPDNVTRRIYFLDGESAVGTKAICAALRRNADSLKFTTRAEVFEGKEAHKIAEKIGASVPSLVVMDQYYAIRAVLRPDDSGARLDAALAADGAIDVAATNTSIPVVTGTSAANGVPQSWLIAGTWAGPSGLSLWGLEAESTARPSLNDPCIVVQFDNVLRGSWEAKTSGANGVILLDTATGDWVWSRATSYACVYVKTIHDRDVTIRISQTGVHTQAWINGEPVALAKDSSPAAVTLRPTSVSIAPTASKNDQGGIMLVQPQRPEGPVYASVHLVSGWNRVLVKLTMQNRAGESFAFKARFDDADGSPARDLSTSLINPISDMPLRAEANRIQPLVTTDAPFNLVHAGEKVKLTVALNRLTTESEQTPVGPLASFRARVGIIVNDYDGKPVMRKSVITTLPGSVPFDLGTAPPIGYYSVQVGVSSESGALIAEYPPDGFSVIGGTAAMKARAPRKKMATTYYWMEDKRFRSLYLPYMQRLGFYRDIGGNPGPCVDLYSEAVKRGIRLAGDLWDFSDKAYVADTVAKIAPFVDSFKSYNEVDIVPRVRGTAEHWTQITRDHYEAVKAVSPNCTVLSASLVRPGADSWFKDCLTLGIEKWVDAWDVHCYPRDAPVLGGSLSNGADETDLGVLKSYKELGRVNDKPFWIGETGARACHGTDARRWQADMVSKMIACANSRADYQEIGFLVPWWYSRENSSLGDIEAAHMPAEAAYYTAGALIDGFPYAKLALGDSIQAAQFGPTTMLWSTGAPGAVALKLDTRQFWVVVDVVGRVRKLKVPSNGLASMRLSPSPLYVLTNVNYQNLTRL